MPADPSLCAFPIVVHTEGTFQLKTFFDADGNVTREQTTVNNFKVTFTNPANGKSIRTVLAGPFITEPNGDGTITVTINGNDGHFTAPGQGVVWSNVGRIVYIAPADDPFTILEVLFVAGQYDLSAGSQVPEICGPLS